MGRQGIPALSLIVAALLVVAIVSGAIAIGAPRFAPPQSPSGRTAPAPFAAPPIAKPSPPDSVLPVVGPAGTIFHFTFAGLPPEAAYRTSYTRGGVVTSHASGDVPANGILQLDLATRAETFPPDSYFFTTRAGDAVRTVSFRVGG